MLLNKYNLFSYRVFLCHNYKLYLEETMDDNIKNTEMLSEHELEMLRLFEEAELADDFINDEALIQNIYAY